MKLIAICAISLATVGCCNALIECISTTKEVPYASEESEISTGTADNSVPTEYDGESTGESKPEDTNGDQDNEPEEGDSNRAPEESTTEQSTDKPEITPPVGNCTPEETWQSNNEGDICGCAIAYDGTQTRMIVVGKTDSGVSICGLYS